MLYSNLTSSGKNDHLYVVIGSHEKFSPQLKVIEVAVTKLLTVLEIYFKPTNNLCITCCLKNRYLNLSVVSCA